MQGVKNAPVGFCHDTADGQKMVILANAYISNWLHMCVFMLS
jgi:hypothetical protein